MITWSNLRPSRTRKTLKRFAGWGFIAEVLYAVHISLDYPSVPFPFFWVTRLPILPAAVFALWVSEGMSGSFYAHWFVLVATNGLSWAIISVGFWAIFRRPRTRLGLCPTCEYDLTANTSGVCPECGTNIHPPTAKQNDQSPR